MSLQEIKGLPELIWALLWVGSMKGKGPFFAATLGTLWTSRTARIIKGPLPSVTLETPSKVYHISIYINTDQKQLRLSHSP